MMKRVTAGRDALGEFAPTFAALNDDVLFGQIWAREDALCARDRSLITVAALVSMGASEVPLGAHLQKAKDNGITQAELAEVLTHLAFYAGWPKAWTALCLAQKIYCAE